ncbi:MAG: rhodanese-like domain-containing protein [Verrucomicrobiota bacterium]
MNTLYEFSLKSLVLFMALLSASRIIAAEYEAISVAELKAAMSDGSVFMIDANGTDRYIANHIPGAIEYYTTADLEAELPKDKDALIVVYCVSEACKLYLNAAHEADFFGYTNVKHLAVGLNGWIEAGMSTESVDIKEARKMRVLGEFPKITVRELREAMDEGSVFLLDANGSERYRRAHIPGAIDYYTTEDLGAALPEDKDMLIVAYCSSPICKLYKRAARDAKSLGYTNIKHLSVGFKGWREADMPTEKTGG